MLNRTSYAIGGVVVGILVTSVMPFTQAVFGSYNEPKKAKGLKVELVRAYAECTVPNTQTAAGIPACSPAEPLDAQCSFTPGKGSGNVKLTIDKAADPVTGFATATVKGKIIGIEGCDGETLLLGLPVRMTGHDCLDNPGADCTILDVDLVAFGYEPGYPSCVVTDGKCALSGTVSFPGAAGSPTVEMNGGVMIVRTTGLEAPVTFALSGIVSFPAAAG